MRIKDKQAYARKMRNRGDKEFEKFKTDIARRTINELQVISAYVLIEKFGFGNKRLLRFLTRFYKVFDDVTNKRISIERLEEEVEEKTGLVYDLQEMEWRDKT